MDASEQTPDIKARIDEWSNSTQDLPSWTKNHLVEQNFLKEFGKHFNEIPIATLTLLIALYEKEKFDREAAMKTLSADQISMLNQVINPNGEDLTAAFERFRNAISSGIRLSSGPGIRTGGTGGYGKTSQD